MMPRFRLAHIWLIALHFAGQPERAQPLGAESVQRARQLGDDVLLGMSLLAYASAAGAAASGPLYAEAFACTERSGDLSTEQVLHNNAAGLPWKWATSRVPEHIWKPQYGPRRQSEPRTPASH